MPDQSSTPALKNPPPASVPVWDMPTRLFHWLLVAMMAGAFLTYEFGDINMTYHKWNGYGLLTLVLYRLMWGVFGSNTAQFSNFVRGPGALWRYLKSQRTSRPQKVLGHNPVGGLMIIALLALILLQGAMGLFTTDDILVQGPLVHLVPSAWSDLAGTLHRIGFYIIAGFAAVHILAATFYWVVKKENLIRAMLTGRKPAAEVPPGETLAAKPLILAAVLLGLSAALVWLGVNIWTL